MTVTDYPPLTSVEETPLHGFALEDGNQWACVLADARADKVSTSLAAFTTPAQYDWRCPHCVEAASYSVEADGDRLVDWVRDNSSLPEQVLLSWLVARSRALLGLGGPPSYWDPPHHCENEHETPQPAVAVVHIIGSDSAANATSLCAGCLVCFFEEWCDEVATAQYEEAHRYEIRPVMPPRGDEDDD